MAQEALSNQAVCGGRFTLGLGTSHHWIIEDMLGLPYERPAHQMRGYLEVLNAALRGPGTVDVENDAYRVHSPIDVTDLPPTPVLLAALGPVVLRLAGEHASGTILWMADERALAEHVVPRITKAAAEAGRPAPRVVVGVPIAICAASEVDDARAWANRVLGQAEYSPNYQRMLARGDAATMGQILAAGDERAVLARVRAFRDAGATDVAVRVLPFGAHREARLASRERALAFAASLCPAV
jgi:F420-dependent oxidoreductase-like protein